MSSLVIKGRLSGTVRSSNFKLVKICLNYKKKLTDMHINDLRDETRQCNKRVHKINQVAIENH